MNSSINETYREDFKLSELTKFAESNRQINSAELVEAVGKAKTRILNQFETSPSKDSEGREECYRQLKGIDMVMINLISDNWSS